MINMSSKLLILVLISTIIMEGSSVNFRINKFEHCNPGVKYKLDLKAKFYRSQGKEFVEGIGDFAVPYGERAGVNLTLLFKKDNNYIKAFSIVEKSLCKMYKSYFGEFFYEVETQAGILAKSCPVPKGKYRLNNFELPFNRLALQTFPKGSLKFIQNIFSTVNGEVLGCNYAEIQNF